MKRFLIVILLIAAVGVVVGAYYMRRNGDAPANAPLTDGRGGGRQRGGGGGFGGGGFGGGAFGGGGVGGARIPMTVELAPVARADMTEAITIVGNLIGAATVEAVPKVNGRLETVAVRLGDRVAKGQTLAKVEDHEILEQVKQAQASHEVAAATIRQREADLKFARTNLERSQNLFDRQLISKQTFDDAEARFQAAEAQLDLVKAQYAQAKARLDELNITLANTVIQSPVNGFIGKRTLDAGAWVTPNSSFLSVVDIGLVRLIANVVEKDLRRVAAGLRADVEVDAYPNERFGGRVARVAPVLDPATRTAQIEVDIDNPQFRLKPGMYAKVHFTVEKHDRTLVVPANAVVDVAGSRGVFLPVEGGTVKFQPVQIGLVNETQIEVSSGLSDGDRVVTTGAAALRDGDRILLAGPPPAGNDLRGGRGRGRSGGDGASRGGRSS